MDAWDRFDDEGNTQTLEKPETQAKAVKGDAWDVYAEKEENPDESWLKSSFRTAYQSLSAFLSTTAPGIATGFWQLLAQGELNDPEEIDRLRMMAHRLGVPWDQEKYDAAAETAIKYIPSVPNLERIIEENTGLPLQAKTPLQKSINLGGQIARLSPGNLPARATAGVTAPAISQGLQQGLGVPEPLADIVGGGVGITAGQYLGNKIPYQARQPSPTPENLKKKLQGNIPGGGGGAPPSPPPPGQFEPTAFEHSQEALNAIKKNIPPEQPPSPPPPSPGPFQQIRTSQAAKPPSLEGRVTPEQQSRVGVRPTREAPRPTTEEAALNQIYPAEIYNSEQTGRGLVNEIRNLDHQDYARVNELYDVSRPMLENVVEPQAQLVQELQAIIEPFSGPPRPGRIPRPSTVERSLVNEVNGILEGLAIIEDGQVVGLRPISSQTLIDQARSIRRLVDFDFAHGDASNIFRPVSQRLTEAARRSAVQTGNEAAVAALDEANAEYGRWAETFNSKYIKPLRNEAKEDFVGNFKSYKSNPDAFRAINEVIQRVPEGHEIIGATQRDVVKEVLDPYFKNPRMSKGPDFERTMNELESYATPEQLNAVRETLRRPPQRLDRRVTEQPIQQAEAPQAQAKPTMSPTQKVASQYLKKKPEYIQKQMDSRSGIREVRELLQGTEQSRKIYENLAKEKIRTLLPEKPTGQGLAKVLEDSKNRELFIEILGREAYEDALQATRKLGEGEIRKESMIQLIKKPTVVKKLAFYGLLYGVL